MMQHNPELLSVAQELRGMQGDAAGAALRPSPELSVGTSKFSPHHGVGGGRWKDKRLDTTAGISWTWERGGKRTLRERQAQALLSAAEMDVQDEARRQTVALHELYYGLKAAQDMARIAGENQRSADDLMGAAKRQVATGAIAAVELARLSVDALAVADEARDAEADLHQARAALALLIGAEAPDALSADDPWPDSTQPPALATPDLERRADLRAATARLGAADAGVALARSERHRDIALGIEAEREPDDISGVTWGLTVSVPLGGRARWQAAQQRAHADRAMADIALRQLQREAKVGLALLRHEVTAAAQRRADYEAMHADTARMAIDGMELAYRRGGASLTDLLDARRSWRAFESQLLAARVEHALTLARWNAATTEPEGVSP